MQKIQATDCAFAAILADGSVIAWGKADHGGDSLQVKDQLRNVHDVQVTSSAFAAIVADDRLLRGAINCRVGTPGQSVTTSGMCSRFRPQVAHLRHFWQTVLLFLGAIHPMVTALQSKMRSGVSGSFRLPIAPLLRSGQMDLLSHGDPQVLVAGGVQQIQATWSTFAAILSDGSVVTWGSQQCE